MFKDIKAVIFDIDGTIMDSIGRIVLCMERACSSTNIPIPSAEAIKEIIGLTLPEAVKTLLPMAQEERIEQTVLAYKQIYTQIEDEQPTTLFPDCLPLFALLKSKGYKIGIATGKSRKGYNRVISYANLKDFIDVSCTGDEVRSKPDPQMLIRLSDELKLPTRACLMVGDSELDLSMAHKANMCAVGVTTGVHSRSRLATIDNLAIVDSLTELGSLLP